MELQMIRSMTKRAVASSGRRGCIGALGYTANCLILLLLIAGCAQRPVADQAPPSAAHSVTAPVEPTSAGRFAAGVSHLVPEDLIVQSEYRGDLDADSDEDLLLVLASAEVNERKSESRTLMVFQRNPMGKLEEAVQNRYAILCESCGGMMGDPFQGIDITPDGFLLRFEGGSRELWSREYRFAYTAATNTWLLKEFRSAAFDKITEASGSSLLTPKEFGSITIERFDPAEIDELASMKN